MAADHCIKKGFSPLLCRARRFNHGTELLSHLFSSATRHFDEKGGPARRTSSSQPDAKAVNDDLNIVLALNLFL